jgi:pimeloyl-ACP methyl ester carboxylesterase
LTLDDLAGDFIKLLDSLKIERCHVVGRSMGGCIGQIIAPPSRSRP